MTKSYRLHAIIVILRENAILMIFYDHFCRLYHLLHVDAICVCRRLITYIKHIILCYSLDHTIIVIMLTYNS